MNRKTKTFFVVLYGLFGTLAVVAIVSINMAEGRTTNTIRGNPRGLRYYAGEFLLGVGMSESTDNKLLLLNDELNSLNLPSKQKFPEYKNVCITEVNITVQGKYTSLFTFGTGDGDSTYELPKRYVVRDLCLQEQPLAIRGEQINQHLKLDASPEKLVFRRLFGTLDPENYFPFDKFMVEIQAKIKLLVTNADDTAREVEVKAGVDGFITTPNWHEHIVSTDVTTEKVSVDFFRPPSQIILTIILLGSILVFTISLLFIQETSSVLEVAVAILLGLWGIQGIITPFNINSALIESCTVALYTLLAVTLVVHFFLFEPFQKRKPLHVTSSILKNISDPETTITPIITNKNQSHSVSLGKATKINDDKKNTVGLLFGLLAFIIGIIYYFDERIRKK